MVRVVMRRARHRKVTSDGCYLYAQSLTSSFLSWLSDSPSFADKHDHILQVLGAPLMQSIQWTKFDTDYIPAIPGVSMSHDFQ